MKLYWDPRKTYTHFSAGHSLSVPLKTLNLLSVFLPRRDFYNLTFIMSSRLSCVPEIRASRDSCMPKARLRNLQKIVIK